MKKLVLLVILAFSLVLSPLATMASTPKLINYQGKLKNLPAQTGPYLVVFEIFEDAAGGTALWIEQKNVTPSEDGTFSTYLGETNPIDLKFDKQYYVQITVGNNQPFPRTQLTSAPSAFHAIDADTAQHAFTADLANDVVPNVLEWDNFTTDAQMAGGVLMGTYPNPQIRPDAILDNIPDGSITTEMLSPNISTSPSGPAGGDMTGTYPDPLIAVGAVKTDRIADGAVTGDKIADMTITDVKITSLDAAKLFNLGALAGTVSVMTDATIDGDGTNALPLGLADDAVTSAKILDGEVMTADIMDAAVTNVKLADDAVMSNNIMDGEVMNADLAVDAVMSDNIMDGEVMTDDIADLNVTNAKLAVDAVRMENIDVNGGVPTDGEFLSWDDVDGEMRWVEPTVFTSAPIAGDGTSADPVTLDPTFGNEDELLIRDAAGWTSGLIDSDNIAENAITPFQLADDAVMTNHIMDGQVMTDDLMDGAVNSAKIENESIATIDLADGSVTNVKIADDAVMTNNIMDGQVMTDDLMDLGVTTDKIADLNVTNGKLADNSVTTLKIVDGEVMTDDIADVNVTEAKLADNAVSTRTITNLNVTETKLADNSVSNRTIQDLAVTEPKLADAAVSTRTIVDLNVTETKLADNSVSNRTIQNLAVTEPKLADAAVSSRTIVDGAVINSKIADLAVTNEKVSSAGQPSGKIMKADGSGGVSWEDDEGLILPWTGSYDGPGDAFTLTHTGIAGSGSAAVFNSTDEDNTDPTVEITKTVADGAGSALAVHGVGVEGANYIATFTNNNLNEGRTVLIQNEAPFSSNGGTLFDPGTPGDATDDYVNPDPAGTDVQDAALVVNNTDPSASGQKLAIKTYGSIQANSAIQGADLISHNGEVIVYDGTNADATLFIQENSFEKTGNPTETLQMFNTAGDFDVDLDGHIDVRNQARIGDGNDENQTTVDGAITAVTVNPNGTVAGPVPVANADLLVNGDGEFTGSLTLGTNQGGATSLNDVFDSGELTSPDPLNPLPVTTIISGSNDAQAITAKAVEEALLNHTLQVSYNNGNTIQTNGNGDIDFDLEDGAFMVHTNNAANSTSGNAEDFTIDGSGYLDAQVNIINTSAGNAVIVEDDLEPQADNTFDLGSDVNRWQDAYVNGGSVHIGPSGGETALPATELAVGYAGNAATFTVDGAVVTTMDAGNDAITFDPDGAGLGTEELYIDAANNNLTTDVDGDGNFDITVDPGGFFGTAGVLIDGNDDGTENFHVNGTVALVNADGDLNNEISVAPGTTGVTIDGNSNGNNNVTVTGTTFGVNADGLTGNEIFANASAVHLNANGDVNIDVDVNGTTVDLDPNSNGTDNFSFAETGATISTTGGAGDIVLSDAGVAANGATQTFSFTNGGGGDLDVSLDGSLTGLNSGHVLGTIGAPGPGTNVLNVDGNISPLPLAATDYELTVNGDANITGTLTVGSLDPDRVVVTNAAGNMVTDDDYTYNETTNVLNIQGTIINNTGDVTVNDNLVPGTPATNTLGTDAVRWKDLFVDGASVHIGSAIGTELLVGYASNAATFGVDASTNLELDQANQQIDLDPNGDGNLMARFDELASIIDFDVNGAATAEVSISAGGITVDGDNAGASTNALYSETGLNRNGGATETYAFANTGGDLDVTVNGDFVATKTGTFSTDAANAGLTINGTALDATDDVEVIGDVDIDGNLTLGTAGNENAVNDIYVSADNLVGPPLVMDPAATDAQLVTALAVQQALLNHDLQVAYNNGNEITTAGNTPILFDLDDGNFEIQTEATVGNNDLLVNGGGVIDAQVNIVNTNATDAVTVDDDLDVRGNLFSDLAANNGTPLNITDDVTMTMQDGDDNVEIIGDAGGTTGNLVSIDKNAGGDNAAAVRVETNEVGINITNAPTVANAVAVTTELDGNTAVAYNAKLNGANGTGLVVDAATGTGADLEVTTGTGLKSLASSGIAVEATATTGRAVTASNNVGNVAQPTTSVSNSNTSANSYAMQIDNGNVSLSSDDATSALANGGTITPGSETIIRLTSGGIVNNITLSAGSLQGQIIIITNEDAGAINISTGTLGTQSIPASTAAQFVWNGSAWVILN